MTFWIFSVLLIAVVLAFLLPPLLRKPTEIIDNRREQNISISKQQLAELELDYKEGAVEKETYLQAKAELEDALYSDLDDAEDVSQASQMTMPPKLPVILVGLLIPAISVGMYLKVGNPAGINESSVDLSQPAKKPQMSIEKMLATLEGKLKDNPDNFQGWVMLGRSYMVVERPADAAKAYEKALALKPEDPSTMLQMADALATSKKGDLLGKPEELVLKALKQDPGNIMGLWLAGMASRQRGANAEAVNYWSQVIPKLAPEERAEVRKMIIEAGGKVDGAAVASSSATTTPAGGNKADSATASIVVKIDIADALKAKVRPEQILFIYAKAVSGPPMPLAAVRKEVRDLPFEVTLNDSMAMTPSAKLSNYKEVKVGARISLSGTPMKSPGDLYTEQSPVKLGESISLTIDKIAK